MIDEKLEKEFFQSKRSETLPWVINDAVEITSGPHAGKRGSVISISSVEPELTYSVELGNGTGDVLVTAKQAKLI